MTSRENVFILALTVMVCLKVTVIHTRSITPIDTPEGLQSFLCEFGYSTSCQERTPLTNEEKRAAIIKFQQFTGLPVTGEVDAATREKMLQPRCQLPDFDTRTARFVLDGNRWMRDIRWILNWTHSSVPDAEAISVMKESVQEWQNWMATISISQSSDLDSEIYVNYPVSDSNGEHGDGQPFRSTTLAHAFYPRPTQPLSGHLHYNTIQPFSTTDPPSATTYSLKYVTVHELGHSLGLRHTSVTRAVMYPYASKGVPYSQLHYDDISGIQAVYGDCHLGPCKNGGTCSHQVSNPRYRCTCPPDYEGTHCEIGPLCSFTSPCGNGGTCIKTSTSYRCDCPVTHVGTNCGTAVCDSSPCLNGGVCQLDASTNTGFYCNCTTKYTGETCQNRKGAVVSGTVPLLRSPWWIVGMTTLAFWWLMAK